MAKRQRGGARPGQRAPLQRGGLSSVTPAPKPAAAARPGSLSADELDRAAELEAQIVAEERAAAAASITRGRDRRRAGADPMPTARSRAAGTLATLTEEEYRSVVRDLRRIGVVFAGIFGLLLASWLLLTALGVVTI
ncbi:MAG TPA: hypothetical protein VLM76_03755 [Patescibacteria group bacterium]|nr:hypothetical protein [Patescibacteria group bacterium]